MSLQFPSSEYKSDETEAFFNTMKDFENKIKQDALTHSKDWFGYTLIYGLSLNQFFFKLKIMGLK